MCDVIVEPRVFTCRRYQSQILYHQHVHVSLSSLDNNLDRVFKMESTLQKKGVRYQMFVGYTCAVYTVSQLKRGQDSNPFKHNITQQKTVNLTALLGYINYLTLGCSTQENKISVNKYSKN